jgi:iron only hydrogenase large subunit-like protein
LQNLAEEYKIENFHFVPRRGDITDKEEVDLLRDNKSRVVVDDKNPVIYRTTEFCVECRRCINICPGKQYSFNHRAGDVIVGTAYEQPLDCIFCGACLKHCPTGSLTDQNNLEEIIRKLDNIKKLAVAIVDPAILESIENEFENMDSREKLAGLLRSMGFERIFDLSYGMKEYAERMKEELVYKNKNKLVLSSHCPAFSRFVEKVYPDLKDNLSKIEIPDELLAEKIKIEYARKEKINPGNIIIISISSCTAKKARKYKYLDHVLTVRELGRLARLKNIEEGNNSESKFDGYFKPDIEAEAIGKPGGLESLLKNSKLKSVAANGIQDIKIILESIRKKEEKYDFLEGLVCSGGCENGGGQSIEVKNSKIKVQN